MKRGLCGGPPRAAAFLLALAQALALALASCATPPPAPAGDPRPSPATGAQAAPGGAASLPASPSPSATASPAPLPSQSAPRPSAPSSATLAATTDGSALRIADPAELARSREERESIEASIVFGSPSSLEKAIKSAASPKSMKAEDGAALAAIARAIYNLAYPSRDALPPGEVDPAALSGNAGALLAAIAEAAAGRVPQVPPSVAATSLGELIPALALFNQVSSDTARRAVEALDRFARLGIPSILPSVLRGVQAERNGDYQGALGLYRSALAIAPDAWIASLGMGRALISLKRSSDALSTLSPLAEAKSGIREFDRPYALALYSSGRYEESAPYVARVLIVDPQDSRLVLIRAHLLVRAKSYQQAQPLLDAYGTVDPSSRLYLLLRCLESEGLRSRDEALKWARKGLAAYPDDPELLVAASRVLFAGPASGSLEARTLAARAFDLTASGAPALPDTGDFESGPALAASRAAAGVEAARLLLSDAVARYRWPDASRYLSRIGASFEDKALAAKVMRKANDPRAFEYASEWYKASPGSEAATEAYLRCLVDSGSDKTAQELIARILPGTIAPQFRSTLYYLQSRLQKSDEAALTLLRSALVENADNSEALAAVYDIQMRRKDYAKARFYLKQAIAISPDDPELEERLKALDAAAPQ